MREFVSLLYVLSVSFCFMTCWCSCLYSAVYCVCISTQFVPLILISFCSLSPSYLEYVFHLLINNYTIICYICIFVVNKSWDFKLICFCKLVFWRLLHLAPSWKNNAVVLRNVFKRVIFLCLYYLNYSFFLINVLFWACS